MNERVAAVTPNGNNVEKHLRPTEPGGSRASGDMGTRFTYETGSRPLKGYTIKRGIGRGGFGEVYFATSDAGKEVALKLIRRNFDVELRGIRHCLNLKHPNLLAIHDIREDDKEDRWVVMEYVTGERLDDAIAAHPNGMPLGQVLAWIHGAGRGVAYLHDHGIVHRDLKPGNIFRDENVVKIGDYGLSKFISCSRRSGQTESVGTVHYMAPEVANGRYGKEIDVYALGVVLYEMLTGRVPFEGESVGEVLMKHLTATPDVSMLAEPYRSVVARALEKDPAKRFPNVWEMLAALPPPPEGGVRTGPWPEEGESSAGGTTPGGSRPFAVPVREEPADEEPIFRAARQLGGKIRDAWSEANIDPLPRIILIALFAFVMLLTAGIWVWPALGILSLYGCYWVVRKIVLAIFPTRRRGERYLSVDHEPALGGGSPPGQPAAPPPAAAAAAHPADAQAAHAGRHRRARHPVMPRWARHERPADALVLKSSRERITELIGSMLGAAAVAMTICLMLMVMVMLRGLRSNGASPLQLWTWLFLVTVAGAWAVQIPSKFWEGSRGETVLRRFVLMAVGFGVGVFASGLASFLKVGLPYGEDILGLHDVGREFGLASSFYAGGQPLWMVYMACFGTLFPVIRWWRQADPLRRARLSLWSVFWPVAVACVIGGFLQFPQAWLMMVACAISVSVQLSSPWVHPRRRHAAAR
jgi:serine/threonine protein kinase